MNHNRGGDKSADRGGKVEDFCIFTSKTYTNDSSKRTIEGMIPMSLNVELHKD